MSEETTGAASSAPSSGASSTQGSESTGVSSTPAQATSAPDTTGTAAAATSTEPGPVPYARFKEINDQLRQAREFQESYGWIREAESNPQQYIDQLLTRAENDQAMQQWLWSRYGRALQGRRGQRVAEQPVAEEPQPDIPVMDANGQVVSHTYSAKQLKALRAWEKSQMDAALAERLQPLEQMRQQQEQQVQRAQAQQQAFQSATQTLDRLRKSEMFTKHEKEFKAYFAEHEEYGDNVDAAWWSYVEAKVLPNRDAATSQKVLTHLQTQANGASVHPSGTATATGRPKFKDWDEALRYFDAHPEEAAASLAKR